MRFLLLAGLGLFASEPWLTNAAVAQDVPPGAPSGYLRQLRFSSDGRYVLAQDDSTVIVINVKPLAVLFRIPALKATAVRFTSDSQDVVFISESPATHVERWHIADRSQVSSVSTGLPACGTAALSPDGRFVACDDSRGTFWLLDVASGRTILRKPLGRERVDQCTQGASRGNGEFDPKKCVSTDGRLGSARIDFSPDGRLLIAAPAVPDGSYIELDLRENRALRFRGDLWLIRSLALPFAFVGPNRVAISALWIGGKGTAVPIVEVPSGKQLGRIPFPEASLSQATYPGFFIIRPCGQYAAGAVEISTGQITPSVSPDMDVFGQYYVTELPNGDVGLYERGNGLQSSVSVKPL